MIYDSGIAERAKCTKKEKKELVPLVRTFIEYAERAKLEGLLALETSLEAVKSPFIKKGLQLVIDGTEPDTVEDILSAEIYYGGDKGKALLEKCMVLEGLLSLQSGDQPKIVAAKLSSYLGDAASDFDYEKTLTEDMEEYLATLNGTTPRSRETALLDQIIFDYNDRSVQRMLREIDMHDLCRALIGASGEAKLRVFRNMSRRAAQVCREDIDYMTGRISETEIYAGQQKISDIFKMLTNEGEIPG